MIVDDYLIKLKMYVHLFSPVYNSNDAANFYHLVNVIEDNVKVNVHIIKLKMISIYMILF